MGRIRLAGGGISHESNTFINLFIPGERQYGEDAIRFHRGKRSNLSAMIEICEREGVDLIPTIYGSPDSKGRVLNKSYYSMLNTLLEGIEKAKPIDGVLLLLHGGGANEDEDDLEGHVLEQVKKIVGDDKIGRASCRERV